MNALDEFVDNVLTAASDAARAASPFAVATVYAVGTGGAADGNDLITVAWMGSYYRVMYDPRLTLKPGDVVLMARTQPMAILIRLGGTPPTS